MIQQGSVFRIEIAERVHASLIDAGVPLQALYGSWAYGDYHFDESCSRTFSDLDLFLPLNADAERIVRALNEALADVIDIRVTVRRHRDLDANFNIGTDRWITLSGFVSSFCNIRQGALPGWRDYQQAKALLMLLRESREVRYAAVAADLGTSAAYNALELKIGTSTHWRSQSYLFDLAAGIAEPFRAVFMLLVQPDAPVQEALTQIESGIDDVAATIPASLVRHTKMKLSATKKAIS